MITFVLVTVFFSRTRCAWIVTYTALIVESRAAAAPDPGWITVVLQKTFALVANWCGELTADAGSATNNACRRLRSWNSATSAGLPTPLRLAFRIAAVMLILEKSSATQSRGTASQNR